MTDARTPGTVAVAAVRVAAGGVHARPCELIDESALFVEVSGVGRYALMWTPTDAAPVAEGFVPQEGWLGDDEPSAAVSLAAGFAFSEGLFDRIDDIESIARCPQAHDVVRIELGPRARDRASERAAHGVRTVRSSCGACGGEEVEHLLHDVAAMNDATTLSLPTLQRFSATMQDRQSLWQATGAAHAALLFAPDGEIVAIAEDLGRHNALDKVIGRALLVGRPLEGAGVVLSSRLSFEMVAKAARARLAIVAGVSAASSLAVRTAHECGITLCGFARDGGATVYTHPRRIVVGAGRFAPSETAPVG